MMESCCQHIQLSQTEIKKWALIRQNYFNVQQRNTNCVTFMQFTGNTLDFARTQLGRQQYKEGTKVYSLLQCRYHRQALCVHWNRSSLETFTSLNNDGLGQAEGWSDHGPKQNGCQKNAHVCKRKSTETRRGTFCNTRLYR